MNVRRCFLFCGIVATVFIAGFTARGSGLTIPPPVLEALDHASGLFKNPGQVESIAESALTELEGAAHTFTRLNTDVLAAAKHLRAE